MHSLQFKKEKKKSETETIVTTDLSSHKINAHAFSKTYD